MKTKLFYVLLFITSISFAQNFTDVDLSTVFTDDVTDVDLAYATNGNIYVAYSSGIDGKAHVKMFNGTTWSEIGTGVTPPFSPKKLDLKINPNTNQPWLLYQDNTGSIDIARFDGTSWVTEVDNIGSYSADIEKVQLKIDDTGYGFVAIQIGTKNYKRLEIFSNKLAGNWKKESVINNYNFISSFDLVSANKIIYTVLKGYTYSYDIVVRETERGTSGKWDNYKELKRIVQNVGSWVYTTNLASSGINNQVLYCSTYNKFSLMNGAAPLHSSSNKFQTLDYQYNSSTESHYAMFLKANNELIVQSYKERLNTWTDENIGIAAGVATKAKLRVSPSQEEVTVVYIEGKKVKLKVKATPKPLPIVYVDKDATGNNDGSSWANAFTNLQDAIDEITIINQEIWVADGTYLPTHNINLSNTDREKTFYIKKHVKIYGGFDGTETQRKDRDPKTNVVVLSGDLNQNDSTSNLTTNEASRSENSYHVVTLKGKIDTRVILDGLTISGGNANANHKLDCAVAKASQYDHRNNAAINLNPVNVNDIIKLDINNCIIENNSAKYGAISRTSPCGTKTVTVDFNIKNSIVRKNYSSLGSIVSVAGSGGYGIHTKSKMINSLFYENDSDGSSSVLALSSSTAASGKPTSISGTEIINCTIANNTSSNLKAISLNRANTVKFYNTIIYGNGSINPINLESGTKPTVESCLIQGGQFGASYEDAKFTDATNEDFTLQASSYAVDKGDNSKVPATVETDLAGEKRIKHNAVDIGAYESNHAKLPEGVYEFVDLNATGTGDGSSWQNAYTDIQTAITQNSGKTILVAAGTYKPTVTSNSKPITASNPREATFLINKKVKMIGSLASGSQSVDYQDITNTPTILSGDVNGNDNANLSEKEATRQDNVYHVVSVKGSFGSGGSMSGFIITGGNANGNIDNSCAIQERYQYDNRTGAGVYSNPDDTGRKVYMSFINCVIEKNTATYYAAFSRFNPCGSQNTESHIDFIHSKINSNFSRFNENMLYYGSQRWGIKAYGKLINTLIYDNETADNTTASALRISGVGTTGNNPVVHVDIINCTVTANKSPNNKAIRIKMFAAGGKIHNTIVYGNGGNDPIMFTDAQPPMTNNLFEGGQLNSISGDPLLNNDFTLQVGSPAIDAGDNSKYPTAYTKDLYGNDRVFNTTIDLGVYEHNPALSTNDVVIKDENFISVYPNPTTSMLFVKTNQEVKRITVFSILGKKVTEIKGSNELNMTNYQSGIYILKIDTAKNSITKKVVKN